MKRKIVLLIVIILMLSLAMVACTQGSVSEAKAKELALENINKVFQTNQTEATVTREQMGCLPDQVGAMATTGNAEDTSRWLYIVSVPSRDDEKYGAYVVESTGEVIYLMQKDSNIVLTEEQKKKADDLASYEQVWGVEHAKVFSYMEQYCNDWVKVNLDNSSPIVVPVYNNMSLDTPVTTTFAADFYVITRDGRLYWIFISWPSMQILFFSHENAK